MDVGRIEQLSSNPPGPFTSKPTPLGADVEFLGSLDASENASPDSSVEQQAVATVEKLLSALGNTADYGASAGHIASLAAALQAVTAFLANRTR